MLKQMTIFEALKVGGPVMYFLFLVSIVSLAIIAERIYYFYLRSRVTAASLISSIKAEFGRSDIQKILQFCRETPTPASAVIAAGLNARDLGEEEIKEAMERQILVEIMGLEKHIAIIGTIGSTAVYIGLLGTVFGIMKTFQDISQAGSGGINVVIHGIAEALVCTAAGLIVAIPAVMAYNYFAKMIKEFVMDMELCASETASLIKLKKGEGR